MPNKPLDCNKKKYTLKEAQQMLKSLQGDPKYEYRSIGGKGEKNYYKCRSCKCYHLTSMENKKKLSKQQVEDKVKEIKLNKEADYWKHKLGVKNDE